MNVANTIRQDFRYSLSSMVLAALGASLGAGLLIYLANEASVKAIAAIIGVGVCVALAFLSGNLRLFCIWALMFTIPFDLSKRFGPIFYKLGGESSFRIEVSDLFLVGLLVFLIR